MVAIPLTPPETILNGNINKLIEIANKNEPKAIIAYFLKISKKNHHPYCLKNTKKYAFPNDYGKCIFKIISSICKFHW